MRKRDWGQHLWARGYCCATVGAVDEKTIKGYLEEQKWDDDGEGPFRVVSGKQRREEHFQAASSRLMDF